MSLFRSPLALIAASGLVCAAPAAAQMVVDIPLAVGFPAPGLPSATVVSLRTPTTNDYSIKAMVGTVAGPGINTSNNMLLWRVGTVAELVARTGGSIAGLPSGVTLSSIETPTVNNLGTIVFTGTLQGPGVNAWNNRAIFSGRPRSLRVIARTGDEAPEQPAGTLFFTYFFAIRGYERSDAGALLLVYFFSALLAAPLWSWLANRMSKHKALMIACLAYAAAQGGERGDAVGCGM
jgi:hypothetical protein